jgi:NTE family protein
VVMTDAEKAQMTRYSKGFGQVQEAPWVVLGGGGLKGLAHIGAWKALSEAGIRPAGIVGTSIGALIGALGASSMDHEDGRRLALRLRRRDIVRVNRRAIWINGIRQESVFRGDALRDYFESLLPVEGWDAIEIDLLINAVDLADGSTEWFGTGERMDVSLLDAVYASAALPVYYPPLRAQGRLLVDGGTTHPLPVEKAVAVGAARIIAIDVGSGRTHDADEALDQGLLGVHSRVFSIGTYRERQRMLESYAGPPMLYVRPRLEGYGTFGFDHAEYFLDEGYRAMKVALETVPA